MKPRQYFLLLVLLSLAISACTNSVTPRSTLRLATTTSTYDSGLLDAILPDFESRYAVEVDVIAVGTGQALALGESGDADVLLVHAPAREEDFIRNGFGSARHAVMFNDFVIVGPRADSAGISEIEEAGQALAAIASEQAPWASRGDESGTHSKEFELWAAAGNESFAAQDWYNSLGQGMAAALQFANEQQAYTLTDRGTFLSLSHSLSNLEILLGGESISQNPDPLLYNPYSVIPVKSSGDLDNVQHFVEWLTALETQRAISKFGRESFGQPLFYPNSEAWRVAE